MSEVVNERWAKIAQKYEGHSAISLAKSFIWAKNKKELVDAEKANIEAEIEFLRLKLPEAMGAADIMKLTVLDEATGEEKRIRIQEEIFISATQESGAATRVVDILKDTGNGGMVKETVAPQTLKSFVTKLRKNSEGGMPDPVLMQLIEAGMTVTAKDMARFY